MSTATVSRKARNVSASVAPVPTDAPETVNVSASIPAPVSADPVASVPTDPAPNLQSILSAPAPVASVPAPADHATRTKEFVGIMDDLGAMIRAQSRVLVGFFAQRGDLVRRAVNVKISGSANKADRASNRDAAMKAADLVAQSNFDPSAEPKPKLARYIACSVLVEFFPGATKLASVGVAEALAETITRVDPPKSWDAPETYAMKPRYNRDAIADLVSRAGAESMTIEQVKTEIERIGGRNVESVPTDTKVDTRAAGTKLAETVWERVASVGEKSEIDPFAFFDEFARLSTQYGFAIAPARDANGNATHKLLKLAR